MSSIKAIYEKLNQFVEETAVAVATIVQVKGSVPREIGAKMIIHPWGQHYGTVGGGCGEGEVIRAGLEVIETAVPRIVKVDLTDPISLESTGVCGGVMEVYVERWQNSDKPLIEQLLMPFEDTQSTALVTVIKATGEQASTLGEQSVVTLYRDGDGIYGQLGFEFLSDIHQCLAERKSQVLCYEKANGQIQLFVEVQCRPPTLIIVGAGHIALPLAQLGKLVDFEVVVLDDRPMYANKQRFPMADRVLAKPLKETLRDWPIDQDTYIVLVTRGHSHDVECLLEVLDSPARYLGMIGSKRRIKAVFELLSQEQAIDPTKFERVHAPIGLDIGGKTPEEIAISIMAEIINVYRGGRIQRSALS